MNIVLDDDGFDKRYNEYNKMIVEYPLLYRNEQLDRYLRENGYFTMPASTKYHGAYPGGLYDHSKAVTNRLRQLTFDNDLKWMRPESPIIVGMFHDLCKCDQYQYVNKGDGNYAYEYNTGTMLKGHGSKSVLILSHLMMLTEEEMLCIRYHMGAYEKEEWAEFDMAIRRYPNVLWTHMSDMLASKVDDI